jgi:hypothetical protein
MSLILVTMVILVAILASYPFVLYMVVISTVVFGPSLLCVLVGVVLLARGNWWRVTLALLIVAFLLPFVILFFIGPAGI